jgi:signal transduction histidine kinase
MQRSLIAYFRRNLKIIGLLGLYAGVFHVVLKLHGAETQAVGYAFLLCAFFTALFFVAGLVRFKRKHEQLTRMLPGVHLSTSGMPEAADQIERDYQAIVEKLYAEVQEKITRYDFAKSQMNDYYTLWVHQIKTPISALKLLLDAHGGEEGLSMKAELFKIEQYVEMALGFIRLESEMSDLRLERQDVHALVKASVRKFRTIFIEKGIRLEFDDFEFETVTDAKWFAFCFEQILSNALKYTHEGTIKIAFGVVQGISERPVLTVADTGIGIQAEDLPRIFERGFTGFNGRLDRKSTGLGLYLCKRGLGKLSMEIAVSSEPGVGTCVHLIFPAFKNVS